MPTAGYSGTPLAKKLGIKEGMVVGVVGGPADLAAKLKPVPPDVEFRGSLRGRLDVALLFVTRKAELSRRFPSAGRAIFPNGGFWVAWPKRASKVPTDITEDTIRELVLPAGLVDVKVCAIDEVWSGLRIVWRKENR
ncbi:MAG: DUF3052 domain-containing protein [Myxococcota bacterium]